jgi:hypothetical protein
MRALDFKCLFGSADATTQWFCPNDKASRRFFCARNSGCPLLLFSTPTDQHQKPNNNTTTTKTDNLLHIVQEPRDAAAQLCGAMMSKEVRRGGGSGLFCCCGLLGRGGLFCGLLRVLVFSSE